MLLDTNAVSALANRDRVLARMLDEAPVAALPFVTVAEYRFGILGSAKREACEKTLDGLLQILPVFLPDLETLHLYASLAHELKVEGRPIPTNDIWIAALARQHGMPILSRDRHFDLIRSVHRVEW
jgi:tRNA(fMet)-specific endonuclease VapC